MKDAGDKKRKILVIDDDSDFLESLHLMIAMDGHEVLALANGLGAVEQYREFDPDVVFLDVRMPAVNGYDVFLRIIQDDPDALIYFTSGYSLDDEQHANALSKSLAGVLTKPIEPSVIRKILDDLTPKADDSGC